MIESEILQAFESGQARVNVLITCAEDSESVKHELISVGVEVTDMIADFKIIYATITASQLNFLRDCSGIDSVELDQQNIIF